MDSKKDIRAIALLAAAGLMGGALFEPPRRRVVSFDPESPIPVTDQLEERQYIDITLDSIPSDPYGMGSLRRRMSGNLDPALRPMYPGGYGRAQAAFRKPHKADPVKKAKRKAQGKARMAGRKK